jgi:hypothetical protein
MARPDTLQNNDMAILARVIGPERNDLSTSAAKAILKIDFEDEDRKRMRELSAKARDGRLSQAEQEEIDDYERVGHLLGLLHSKARRALKKPINGR